MGGLFAALVTTAGALRATDRQLMTIQNNVSNASTPGYAKQQLQLQARQFDVRLGLPGGVDIGELVSFRDSFSERNVWRQMHSLGRYTEQQTMLEQLEGAFPITNGAGVPGALNQFFNSVSSWSVNPNDPVARQVVLDRAESVARAFNSNAAALGEATSEVDSRLRSVVDRINTIAGDIREVNAERRSDRQKVSDPALDARLYASLEELSSLVDFRILEQDDGSIQVLLGGQTPIVIGDRLYEISADYSFGEPRILNKQGEEITGQVSNGALAGLIETRNQLIPGYLSDLNRLAETFADRVNQVLAGGLDANGSPPQVDLFTYDPTIGSASSLRVNPLDPSALAAAESGAPGGNGNALALAALAESPEIDGESFNGFYGQLGALVGRDLRHAQDNVNTFTELATQSKILREDRSGVSLDEEAARLVEAQRAYQANAQLFKVLNELTDTLIGLLR